MAARSADLRRILKKLERLGKEPRAKIRKAIDTSAEELVAAQKSVVPVDDGDLRDSIRIEDGNHDLRVVVTAGGEATTRPVRNGVDASYDYAFAQEFGTSDQTPNPFFYGPYRLMKRRIIGRVHRVGRQVWRSIWGGR